MYTRTHVHTYTRTAPVSLVLRHHLPGVLAYYVILLSPIVEEGAPPVDARAARRDPFVLAFEQAYVAAAHVMFVGRAEALHNRHYMGWGLRLIGVWVEVGVEDGVEVGVGLGGFEVVIRAKGTESIKCEQ